MKCKCVFVKAIVLSLFAFKSIAQSENYFFIPSEHLSITCNKTTNLIFPYSVQSIDRGSQDILVQQPKGTANIVQVKAGKQNFPQTNLSVITIDGQLYSFIVDYTSQPSQLNIVVTNGTTTGPDSILKEPVKLSSSYNQARLRKVAEKISESKAVQVKKDRENEMELRLIGIYISDDVFYFRLQLQNNSNVGYDLGDIKFTIKDKQKSKRTATQEMEVQSIYTYGSLVNVPGDSAKACIMALPKFTLPEEKYLFIQLTEKDGGRELHLKLKNRHIINAKAIESFQVQR
jgi:conjugative transposon TraN protein